MPNSIVTARDGPDYRIYDAPCDKRHGGLATAIIVSALNVVRASVRMVPVLCTELLQFLETHPECSDVVSADAPGSAPMVAACPARSTALSQGRRTPGVFTSWDRSFET